MMLTAGTMIEGAFRLIREHPAAVAFWGLLYLAGTVAMMLAVRPVIEMQMADAGAVSPTTIMGRVFLLQIGFFILFVILMAAAQRAVLHPERQGFFFLRLGGDELRFIALTLLFFVGAYVVLAFTGIVAALVAAGAGAAIGTGGAVAIGIILFLLLFAFIIWLEVRLSLAFPLTLLRGKFVIGESWRRTRGHFWTLFGGYLAIFVVVVVLSIIAGLVTSGSYFASMLGNLNNPDAMQQAMAAQMEQQYGSISAMTVIGWVVSAAAGAIMIALFGGSAAHAARALVADEDLAETFA